MVAQKDAGTIRRQILNRKILTAILGFALAIAMVSNAEALHTGWQAPDEATDLKNPFSSDKSAITQGKKIYDKQCAKCHGTGGKGDGYAAGSLQIELPDFTNKEITESETDGEWFWKVRTGQFEMPPFQLFLKDSDVWKVIVYTRTLAK